MDDDVEDVTASAGPMDSSAELALHQQLLDGHPTARARVAEAYLDPVSRILATLYPHANSRNPELIGDAAIDGVMVYLNRPGGYDPQQARLLTYLVGISRNKLRTLLGKEMHMVGATDEVNRVRLVSIESTNDRGESVGNRPSEQNSEVETETIAHQEDSRFMEWLRPRFTNAADLAVVELILTRNTSTTAYAAALHLDPQSLSAQDLANQAYNHKERVKKRLRRLYRAYKEGRELRPYKWRRPMEPSSNE